MSSRRSNHKSLIKKVMPRELCIGILTFGLICIFHPAVHAASPAASEDVVFTAAQKLQQAQKWEESVAKFGEIVRLSPRSEVSQRARIEIGKYHKYHRDWDKALAQYDEAISVNPHSRAAHDAKTAAAAIYFFRQDFPNALKIFKDVLAQTKDWDQVKYCSYWIKEVTRRISLTGDETFACGPKSLRIALEKLGIQIQEREFAGLFEYRGGNKVSLANLREVAASKGLKPKVVRCAAGETPNLDTPFIALIEPDHYVVVTNSHETGVSYIDPGRPQEEQKVNAQEFAREFKGYALVFQETRYYARAAGEKEAHEASGGICTCCPVSGLGGPDGSNKNAAYDGGGSAAGCGGGNVGMPTWMVNMVNLNFVVQDVDLRYAARGMTIDFVRTYNGDDPRSGVFGRSWTHNYNVVLTANPDNSIDIRRGDGRIDHFVWNGTRYQGPANSYDTLIKNADTSYTLTLQGSNTQYNFTSAGVLHNIKDRNGNTVSLTYDAAGRLTAITGPNGTQTTLTYNAAGKVIKLTVPDGRFVMYSYDANGNLVSSTDMVQATSSFTYDANSYMTAITTPHRGRTTIGYGLWAGYYITSLTDALGNKRSYARTPSWDYETKVVDARGATTLYASNSGGTTASITTASGNKVTFEYDSLGNRIGITDATGAKTRLTYDGAGNVLSVTDPLNNRVTLNYDANNNLISAADPKGKVYQFGYDGKGNLLSAKDPDNQVTGFVYSSYGQLTRLTDCKGGVTDFAYDVQGNLQKMTGPLGKFTTYGYDTLGRLTSLTDPKGQTFGYTYDGVDHLTKVTYPNASMAVYTYTCCNLLQAQDNNGTLRFAYDAIGRISSFTNADNNVIGYKYDTAGNLIELAYPDGKKVTYTYDADNRLLKVTDWLGNVTEYRYDRRGQLSAAISPGLLTLYRYDAAGRLIKLFNYNRATLAVQSSFEFTLDANSNRANIKRYLPLMSGTFPADNRGSYSYNSDNQLITAPGRTFSYDNNGNTVAIAGTNPGAFTYDYNNMLTQYTAGSTAMNFKYDAMGNRIAKTVNSTTTRYIGGLVETDASGVITAYYVYGLGLIAQIRGTASYYYQYDGIGSTVAITDKTGAIKNKYAYDDFGQLATNSTETVANPFKYVGKYGVRTDANDLLYMRARYYMPSIGRFVNKDPIGFGSGLNHYIYAKENPISFIDPLGLKSIADEIDDFLRARELLWWLSERYWVYLHGTVTFPGLPASLGENIPVDYCAGPYGSYPGERLLGFPIRRKNESMIIDLIIDIYYPVYPDTTTGNQGNLPGGYLR